MLYMGRQGTLAWPSPIIPHCPHYSAHALACTARTRKHAALVSSDLGHPYSLPPYRAPCHTLFTLHAPTQDVSLYSWTEENWAFTLPTAPPLFTGGGKCGTAPPPSAVRHAMGTMGGGVEGLNGSMASQCRVESQGYEGGPEGHNCVSHNLPRLLAFTPMPPCLLFSTLTSFPLSLLSGINTAFLQKTVKLGDVVDIVFENLTPVMHPMHIHG